MSAQPEAYKAAIWYRIPGAVKGQDTDVIIGSDVNPKSDVRLRFSTFPEPGSKDLLGIQFRWKRGEQYGISYYDKTGKPSTEYFITLKFPANSYGVKVKALSNRASARLKDYLPKNKTLVTVRIKFHERYQRIVDGWGLPFTGTTPEITDVVMKNAPIQGVKSLYHIISQNDFFLLCLATDAEDVMRSLDLGKKEACVTHDYPL